MSVAVSACVLACNEAKNLEVCLQSLAWADEIVVVIDAKSTDASEKVARRLWRLPRLGSVEKRPA